MAMKKKATSKKASAKTSMKPPAGGPVKTSKKTSKIAGIRKTSKKIVDKVLVTITPQLQGKIDALIKTLENSREGGINNLSLLAGKILVRAQDVSKSLRTSGPKKGTTKK